MPFKQTKPPNVTEEEYKHIISDWRDLNRKGQSTVKESTWEEIEDGIENIFRPIEEAEESVINGVVGFLNSAWGIFLMLVLILVVILLLGLCAMCKDWKHKRSLRRDVRRNFEIQLENLQQRQIISPKNGAKTSSV